MTRYELAFVLVCATALVFILFAPSQTGTAPAVDPAGTSFRQAEGLRELFAVDADGGVIVGGDLTARDVACAWLREKHVKSECSK